MKKAILDLDIRADHALVKTTLVNDGSHSVGEPLRVPLVESAGGRNWLTTMSDVVKTLVASDRELEINVVYDRLTVRYHDNHCLDILGGGRNFGGAVGGYTWVLQNLLSKESIKFRTKARPTELLVDVRETILTLLVLDSKTGSLLSLTAVGSDSKLYGIFDHPTLKDIVTDLDENPTMESYGYLYGDNTDVKMCDIRYCGGLLNLPDENSGRKEIVITDSYLLNDIHKDLFVLT